VGRSIYSLLATLQIFLERDLSHPYKYEITRVHCRMLCPFKEEPMNTPKTLTAPVEILRNGFSAHDVVASDATAVYKNITHLTLSIPRTLQCGEVLDTVTVVRGCAETWMEYPEAPTVRQRLTESLVLLADLLEASGDVEGSKQARWCAMFVCSRDIESGRIILPAELDLRI
jgi:hypothetical protein